MAQKLEDLQPTVAGIVKGISSISAIPLASGDTLDKHVIQDDGTLRDEIESSLKSFGWAIVVNLPIGASTVSQVSAREQSPDNNGKAKFDVLVVIQLRTVPKTNTGATAIPFYPTLMAIIKAMLSWKPVVGENGFELLKERPFEPDYEDTGCLTYDIRFLKTVLL